MRKLADIDLIHDYGFPDKTSKKLQKYQLISRPLDVFYTLPGFSCPVEFLKILNAVLVPLQ